MKAKFITQIGKIRALPEETKDKILRHHFYTGHPIYDTAKKFNLPYKALLSFLVEKINEREYLKKKFEDSYQPKTAYYESEAEIMKAPILPIKMSYYINLDSEITIKSLYK